MPNTFTDLFFGYTAFWGLIAGYVVMLMNRQRSLQTRLDELTARLERLRPKNSPKSSTPE